MRVRETALLSEGERGGLQGALLCSEGLKEESFYHAKGSLSVNGSMHIFMLMMVINLEK